MRVSYEDFSTQSNSTQTNSYQGASKYVKYFSLKNNGDEAIVRFMYDNPSEFDILDIHSVKNGQWDIKYNCIRDPREPLDNCPLCKAGVKVERKFYIKLIQYFNDNGTIRAEARVWERSPSYVGILKSFMDEYSPLSNYVFKVKRVGEAGSKSTQYTILPCNPTVYTSEVYKKDVSLFEKYEVLGSTVLEKNWDELQELVSKRPTSTFTLNNKAQSSSFDYNSQTHSTPAASNTPKEEVSVRQYNQSNEMPWDDPTSTTQFTPRRY